MLVTIINDQAILDIDNRLFKKLSGYLADKFDRDKSSELNIIFVDRQKIRQLNKSYRNMDSETDVLSFKYKNGDVTASFDTEHGFSVVGEIIISPEVALENSKSIKRNGFDCWDLTREITLLIAHGILHLYSYDHEKRNERLEMENIQDSLLRDVFSKFAI